MTKKKKKKKSGSILWKEGSAQEAERSWKNLEENVSDDYKAL